MKNKEMSFFDQMRNKSEKLHMDEHNAIMQEQDNLFRIVSVVELMSKIIYSHHVFEVLLP